MKINQPSIFQFPRKGCFLHNSIFLFVDLQLEYLSFGRAFALENLEDCLSNSLKILEMARESGMAIAHFRRLMDGTFFNHETKFSNWIEDFQPRPNEMVFEREQPSIYSNAAFTAFLGSINFPELIVTGLTGENSCLSTAVESAHRNHRATFIHDASASRSISNLSEKKSHAFVTEIINVYAEVTTTREIISSINRSHTLLRGNNEIRYI